jgi:hypothetical protein
MDADTDMETMEQLREDMQRLAALEDMYTKLKLQNAVLERQLMVGCFRWPALRFAAFVKKRRCKCMLFGGPRSFGDGAPAARLQQRSPNNSGGS